jgi:hypothetical protein
MAASVVRTRPAPSRQVTWKLTTPTWPTLTGRTKVLLIGAMGLFGALPYAEEMLRCLHRRPTIQTQPPRDEQSEDRSDPLRP